MKKVAIIGGTGTLGNAILPMILENPQVERVRILSRGEHKQAEMAAKYAGKPVDFMLGDVRDQDRVMRFLEGIDECFHFAAFKSIDSAEYNPMEAIKTNILGTENVIRACIFHGIERAVLTSTDKAVAPINIYGCSKLMAELLFIGGNIGDHGTKFSAVRYGNVFGSNGSVVSKWLYGERVLTHKDMTRFFFSQKDAAQFVLKAMRECHGGETFIPKMKATTMGELYVSYFNGVVFGSILTPIESGLRPGEKMHEDLISIHEIPLVTETPWCFVRWPTQKFYPMEIYGDPIDHALSSATAEKLTREELVKLWDTVR